MWFFLLLVLCLVYSLWRLRYFASNGVKTLVPVPFLGNLTAVTFGRENFVEVIEAGYNKFKDQRYFGIYQYHVPTLVPRDPELIRRIMVADFHAFSDRGVHIDQACDPLFGRNLIMLRGSRWRTMRAALTPAFSASRCRSMAPLMAICAKNVQIYLSERVREGIQLDVDEISTAYVNDVIASCAFGFATDSLQDPHNCIFRLAKRAVVQDTTQIMKFFGYENMKTLMQLLNVKIIKSSDAEQFGELFKSALRARRAGAAPRPDFIQTLVDAADFSDDDLVAQAVLFYIAGYDTTANLLNYFLLEMAANPTIQEKLQSELDQLPGSHEDKEAYDSVQGLEYLEMCVCEVLRLWPLVGAADRRSVARYDFGPNQTGGDTHYVAGAGVHVWLPVYSLHRDERYWAEPQRCDPGRFSAANKQHILPYTYMPFGTGPRHCIGSRFATTAAKVFLAQFLRHYTVSGGGSRQLHPRAFILRPKHGFTLTVTPRNNHISA
ncbi:cytochrome P450 9e2-like isoform X2 [Leguminivora glycinivorella]|uniref:cytochrome P450 9e2-like isoform X2 n=1 Tax=Leguminivora glycinivorella TaxID=1035111 RepID=UPI00200F88B4|nr:cytochrome P450 9e2-like isoform X2 [Leguminivora glycinivorella]